MLRIAAHGGLGEDEASFRDRVITRIEQFAATGGIPEARYGKLFGWGERPSSFSFGGLGCEPSGHFRQILSCMRETQLNLFTARLPDIAAELLRRFQTDRNDFASMFVFRAGEGSYDSIPLLHLIPPADFAAAILDGVRLGERERLREILKPLFERTGPHPDWPLEKAWWPRVKAAYLNQAAVLPPLPGAQARSFARIFPEHDDENG
ncbi:MAG: hypothetical protein IE922_11610 [Sphingomonadales bacterium]|nr:hypothetical protein [Sphingomonadales bacterium]